MSHISYVKRFWKRLSERDGSKCHYCSIELIPPNTDKHDTHYFEFIGEDYSIRKDAMYLRWNIKQGFASASVDHVKPKCEGGLDTLDNLVLCCKNCNTKKHVKSYETYTKVMVVQS